MVTTDRGRLEGLVQGCLRREQELASPEAAAFLRANAARLEQRLRSLSAWCEGAGPAEVGVAGLSAFELSDAMDRLNAAARRRERGLEPDLP